MAPINLARHEQIILRTALGSCHLVAAAAVTFVEERDPIDPLLSKLRLIEWELAACQDILGEDIEESQ